MNTFCQYFPCMALLRLAIHYPCATNSSLTMVLKWAMNYPTGINSKGPIIVRLSHTLVRPPNEVADAWLADASAGD